MNMVCRHLTSMLVRSWHLWTRYVYNGLQALSNLIIIHFQSLSDRELQAKALKEKYGITLKDACHRLYMAETAKLEALDTAEKTLSVICRRMDKASSETLPPIHLIDQGEFDQHILPHSIWPRSENNPADSEGLIDLDGPAV